MLQKYRIYHYLWIEMACFGAIILIVFAWYISSFKIVDWSIFFLVGLHIGLCIVLIWSQLRRGTIDIFHPIIFYCAFFVFPMIIIKGLALTFGIKPRFLWLIPDSYKYLDLALIFTFIGTICLILGFYFTFARNVAKRLPLPRLLSIHLRLRWQTLFITYVIGLAFVLYLGKLGIFGASLAEFKRSFTWINWVQQFSKWHLMSLFLLVFYMVCLKKPIWLIVTGLAFATSIILAILSGNRSGLLWIILLCMAAFLYAKYPRIKLGKLALWLVGLFIVILLGIILISPYRTLRQAEVAYDTLSLTEIKSLMQESTENLLSWKIIDIFDYTKDRLFERLCVIELLAVTLAHANDEGVKASEQSVGIDNNIMKNLIYGFVPRAIWPDKPIVSDFGLWFSRIYLGTPYRTWNSPSIFGDLYRNFGFLGIPLGMFLLGILLRIIYEKLIVEGNGNALAILAYYFLLTGVNYEASYSFFSNWIRIIFILLPLFWIVTRGRRRSALSTVKGIL